MFALVDCNNFYASCQRVFDPSLIGKPIAILSNNDGCVIARSNECKPYIPMGAPAHQFKEEFEKNNVHVFSSNYALYGDMSKRVMSTLAEFTPDMEVYSVDEAFLKFIGFENYDLLEYGRNIHRRVMKCTGIPVSIGIAPTKALAKIANRIAKKFPDRTANAYVIDTEEKRIKALKWLEIGDVWGIGRQHAKKLLALNVRTAYQFTQMSDDWVRHNMSVVGLRLKHDLQGISSIDFEEVKPKQNIACNRSFDRMLRDKEDLRERISTFAGTVAEKLRNDKLHANSIDVVLWSNPFREDLPQYAKRIRIKTEFPTNSTFEINRLALIALDMAFKQGIDYKKAGVMVGSITPADCYQMKIFGGENPKHQDVLKVIDRLNRKIGNTKIRFGAQSLKRKWKMRRERLSPSYTSRWSDLITINCENC
ncbi:Y-family DNA polymerase [Flavobacterium sp. WW92]|uniref:Y-family DNA polymerase n=1 Tax=unclassified Flavobacterium TaxID=196869 RepID=UPI0022255209|nr:MULTISPECIES: Y-family DNA polymerase [unclassified Flavobacterium]WDO13068.1 Y-family DNA polymerase [Flavobacterium sp. WW92]